MTFCGRKIYLEPEVQNYKRGQEILAKYLDASLIEAPSHWKIPEFHGNHGSMKDWIKIKKHIISLGIKRSLSLQCKHKKL